MTRWTVYTPMADYRGIFAASADAAILKVWRMLAERVDKRLMFARAEV